MPSMYPENPDDKRRDTGKKTMGVYDRPGRRGPSRGIIFAIVIAIVILIAFLIASGFATEPQVVADTVLAEIDFANMPASFILSPR